MLRTAEVGAEALRISGVGAEVLRTAEVGIEVLRISGAGAEVLRTAEVEAEVLRTWIAPEARAGIGAGPERIWTGLEVRIRGRVRGEAVRVNVRRKLGNRIYRQRTKQSSSDR